MIWMFGGGGLELLLDAFGRQPFRVGGVFLFVCAVLFVFFLGARTASHTGIYFISRIILLVISAVAGVVCLWFLYAGLVNLLVGKSSAAQLWLVVGTFLVALAAAAIKYSVAWRVSYWITFLVTLASIPAIFIAILGLGWMVNHLVCSGRPITPFVTPPCNWLDFYELPSWAKESFEYFAGLGFEGIVSKKLNGPYRSGQVELDQSQKPGFAGSHSASCLRTYAVQ